MAGEVEEGLLGAAEGWPFGLDVAAAAREPGRSFLPPAVLAGDFDGASSWDVACVLDASLRELAAVEAALDLAIGRAVGRLAEGGWFRNLGHARLRDLAPARYGFSWSHGRELRDLAVRLESLPRLRAAFLSGALSRSKLREVARVATAETEAGWLGLARRSSVRVLAEAVAAFRTGTSAQPAAREDADDLVRVRWRSSQEDAAAWEGWGRHLVRAVTGLEGPDWQLAEALAADTLARLGGPSAGAAGAEPGASPGSGRGRPPRRRRRRAGTGPTPALLRRLARRGRWWGRGPEVLLAAEHAEDGRDAWEVHARLARLVALRHGVAFERSRVLLFAHSRASYRALGFRACDDYALKAHGLSARELAQSVALQSQLLGLPALSAAWQSGRLGALVVALLLRVVARGTESVWVEHAATVPLKRLELEVDWHLACRATLPWGEYVRLLGGVPHPEVPTSRLRLDWQEFFGVREAERESARERRRRSRGPRGRAVGACTCRGVERGGEPSRGEGEGAGVGGACTCHGAERGGKPSRTEGEDGSTGGACTRRGAMQGGEPSHGEGKGESVGGACTCRGAERGAVGCDLRAGSVVAAEDEPSPELEDAPELLRSLRRRRWVSFRAPSAVAALWSEALAVVRDRLGPASDDGACVHWMLVAFAHAAAEEERRSVTTREARRRHAIFERDGWQCCMPHCRSRCNLHVHHVRFRSAGGSDAAWNLVTLCAGCHRLVHEGRVVLLGTAPLDLTALVGRHEDGRPRETWRVA